MILYSIETDFIYDTAIHKVIPNDSVEISLTEKHEHMGNITYDGKRRVKHAYPFVFEDIPPPSTEELQKRHSDTENQWVRSVMPEIDYQINLHIDNDKRKTSTQIEWSNLRKALRDYIEGGVVTQPERPQRPDGLPW